MIKTATGVSKSGTPGTRFSIQWKASFSPSKVTYLLGTHPLETAPYITITHRRPESIE